ncbi:sodium/calcium exchanger family protein [Candidatus Mycoplasma haematolamae str. Purdue]|uniref:Sodium/calcium exchanger family protein n=1 Tax=Mycoplasma haematolamae (strain Purdue) TaxID=1212765 RepID=I7C5B1_MYCHA|nr:sodium/calcium exchanger family protein [Candidatus Mycoplasma haematolamae str. Purdue]
MLDRFQLSEKFVGSSLLAAGTSLAEAINAFTAGIYDLLGSNGERKEQSSQISYSLNSLYNLTGANSVQIVFLSGVAFTIYFLIRKKKFSEREYNLFLRSVFQGKALLWSISTAELALLLGCVATSSFSSSLKIGNYNLLPCLFFLVWVLYMVFTKKTDSPEDASLEAKSYTNIFQKFGNGQFICIFLLIFVSFTGLAFWNFNLVSKFETVFKIPKNIGLGTILSLITSFPEFSSFFFLFKSRCYDTACAGLFGSALFNLMLPFFTQLIKSDWLFSSLGSNQSSLIFWLAGVLGVNLFFALGFYTNKEGRFLVNKGNYWTLFWSGLIIIGYLLSSLVISPILFNDVQAGVTK